MSKQYDPFLAGSMAGFVASFVGSPIDLVSASLHDAWWVAMRYTLLDRSDTRNDMSFDSFEIRISINK